MIYAFYLPEEFINEIELPCHGDEFENQITDHPKTIRYSITSLEEAYNEKKIIGGYLIFLDLSVEELAKEIKQRYKENKIPKHLKEHLKTSSESYQIDPDTPLSIPNRSLKDMHVKDIPEKLKLKPDNFTKCKCDSNQFWSRKDGCWKCTDCFKPI